MKAKEKNNTIRTTDTDHINFLEQFVQRRFYVVLNIDDGTIREQIDKVMRYINIERWTSK